MPDNRKRKIDTIPNNIPAKQPRNETISNHNLFSDISNLKDLFITKPKELIEAVNDLVINLKKDNLLTRSQYSEVLQHVFYRLAHPKIDTNLVKPINILILTEIFFNNLFNQEVLLNEDSSINNLLKSDEKSGMNIISCIFRNSDLTKGLFLFLEKKHQQWQQNQNFAENFIRSFDNNNFTTLASPESVNFAENFLKSVLTSRDENGFTPLINTCTNNILESVKEIFKAVDDFIPENKRSEFVKELLQQKNKKGFTALIDACINNSELVKEIFKAVDDFIFKGDTLLKDERPEFVKELLQQENNDGYTPLISACTNNNPEAVEMIFAAIKKFITDQKKRAEIIEELLLTKNKDGYTPLNAACRSNNPEAVEKIFAAIGQFITNPEKRTEIIKKLLLTKDEYGSTLLNAACRSNNPEAVEKIFAAIGQLIPEENQKEKQVEIIEELLLTKDEYGFTPLNSACRGNNSKAVEMIFVAIDKFILDKDKQSEFVKQLLQQENPAGFTAFISAFANKSPKSVELIFENVAKFILGEDEKSEFVKKLLQQENKSGFTALSNACYRQSPESVKLIFNAIKEFIPKGEERNKFVNNLINHKNKNNLTPIGSIKKANQAMQDAFKEGIESCVTNPETKQQILSNLNSNSRNPSTHTQPNFAGPVNLVERWGR